MEQEFKLRIKEYLLDNQLKIREVWSRLSEEQIWQRPNEECLAPANQLIHLTGNIRQWVLSNLGNAPDVRNRDAEFAARTGETKQEILAAFEQVLAKALQLLDQPHPLQKPLRIQGHDTTPIGVWIHMAEHLSYHTGQLVFFAKMLSPKPFDFYPDWALTERKM